MQESPQHIEKNDGTPERKPQKRPCPRASSVLGTAVILADIPVGQVVSTKQPLDLNTVESRAFKFAVRWPSRAQPP